VSDFITDIPWDWEILDTLTNEVIDRGYGFSSLRYKLKDLNYPVIKNPKYKK